MGITYLILIFLALFHTKDSSVIVMIEQNDDECITCHANLIDRSVVHPELDSTCDICHTSNGEEHPLSNVKGFTLSEPLPMLCFNCHTDFQDNMDQNNYMHGPVFDGHSCINCHDPHSSDHPKLVNTADNELCLNCHGRTIQTDSASITNIKQVLSRAKSIHPPVESGGCVTCHNPHFSEKKFLLIGTFLSQQYVKADVENFEICFMCHDTDIIEAETTEFGTNFRNAKTNLHYIHTNGDKGRNCIMCHDIHGAKGDRLIRDKVKFGKWEMRIDFTLTDDGGSCLTACHNKKTYNRTITE